MPGNWPPPTPKSRMFRIKFIVVDRTRAAFLREGEDLYLDRLKRYARTEWICVKPAKILKGRGEDTILRQEGAAILEKVAPRDWVIALDREGQALDSPGLARWLEEVSARAGGGPLCFVVGGPLGLSGDVLDRAQGSLSLSRLTLTHEMSRLLLLEQIYRAFTISRGEKYHK